MRCIYQPTVSTLVELIAVLLVWVHLQPVLLGAAGVLRRGSSGEGKHECGGGDHVGPGAGATLSPAPRQHREVVHIHWPLLLLPSWRYGIWLVACVDM